MTKQELQDHLKQNIWEEDKEGNIYGYGAAIVVSALYKKIYGDYPKIGLSGSQGGAAESLRDILPESDMPFEPIKSNVKSFTKSLENLINTHCIENEWDMPDFIMAELITNFIYSTAPQMKKNLDWHGVDSVCHPKNKR